MQSVDIAIIGGGIAGLSAAIACQAVDRDAHVFEAAPAFQPLGTSLSLWPNAMACLAEWGLDANVSKDGAPIKSVAWRKTDGSAYLDVEMHDHYQAAGHQGYCVRRSDLHRRLAAAIPNDRLSTDHHLSKFDDDGNGVTLHFSNGNTVRANHVIAADGVWSRLRAGLLNDGTPQPAGYGAWLGLSSAPALAKAPFEGTEYFGHNGRMGVFETGQNTRYWFFIHNAVGASEAATLTDPSEVLALIQDWPAQFQKLVAATPNGTVSKVGFFDRPVARRWGKGCITIIGDAIHPMLPNLGQGACQAIEDAHALGNALKTGKSGPDITRWIEAKRYKRVRKMQKTSRQVGQLAQTENAVTRAVRGLSGTWPFSIGTHRQFKDQFTR